MKNVRKNSGGASVDTFSTINNNFLNTENRMARVNLDTSPAYLNGQSAALTFDAIEITDETQYSSFKNPKILPNIESGTTESAGTDADTSETKVLPYSRISHRVLWHLPLQVCPLQKPLSLSLHKGTKPRLSWI